MRLGACLVVFVTACATARAQTDAGLGRPPDPAGRDAQDRVAGEAAGAEADFQAAVTHFSRGDYAAARELLEGFVVRHPEHPFRVSAAALLARIALGRGDATGAKQLLDMHAPGAAELSVMFVRGVAESRLGNAPQALALLKPFVDRGPPALAGAANDHEADLLLRAALAEALAAQGDVIGALAEWDRYARAGVARDHEKIYARTRAEELAARLPAEARARRRSLGFEGASPALGPGDPMRFGFAVPQSGGLRVLGDVALRAAMLAIGEPGRSGETPAFQVLVRDTAVGGERAERGVAELVRQEAVIGIVGLGDRRAIDQATRDGVPYLALDGQAPGRETTAFQIAHTPEGHATELARRALAAGARTFAVLGPDSAVGRRLAEAFKQAVAAGGGRVVKEQTYRARANTFSADVAQLRQVSFDALFVPEVAQRLELVAPALGFADLWSRAPGTRRTGGPRTREFLLLSTATALSHSLIKNVGKFVQGALLSPGFFAAEDPRSAAFVARFRQLYSRDPTATDAYSNDSAWLLRAAVERGARTRADVLRHIAATRFEGATGTVRFGAEHGRADPPLVYVVDGEEIRVLP